jgi:hypothetical protein
MPSGELAHFDPVVNPKLIDVPVGGIVDRDHIHIADHRL